MASFNHHKDTLNSFFFNPLYEVYPFSNRQYDCSSISDLEFLKMGVSRCLSSSTSGNAFVENYLIDQQGRIHVGHFFETLKSKRRLENLQSVNHLTHSYLKDHIEDELAKIEELKNWHLYAGDGHYHRAACFDKATSALGSSKEPTKAATGHFFRLDLRTHHLDHLALASPKDGKKLEHDMKMLKRQEAQTLRAKAPKGHKVLYLWDRASIDFSFWNKMKHQNGIYFATLAKKNTVAQKIRDLNEIDHEDHRNEGLVSDRLVETSEKFEIREIVYIDPSTGKEYRYLTNEKTLPAWIIVLLYKHRWDIEKVFDETKTKF